MLINHVKYTPEGIVESLKIETIRLAHHQERVEAGSARALDGFIASLERIKFLATLYEGLEKREETK